MELKTVKKTIKELAVMVLQVSRDTMFVFSFEPFGNPNKYWDAVFISNNGSEDVLFYHGDIGLFKTLEDDADAEVVCKQLLEWLELFEGLKRSDDTEVYIQVRSEVKNFLFKD